MKTWLIGLGCVLAAGAGSSLAAEMVDKASAERGREFLFRRSYNPPVWFSDVYNKAWKQWGVKEKPADYGAAFRQRYGLHEAPFDNGGLPMGLMEARGLLGKGVVNNCLLCHAGRVAGQMIIGVGNHALDLQTLFEDLAAADGLKFEFAFQFSYVRATIDPTTPVAFLMGFRDPDLNIQKHIKLDYGRDVCSDPPAWWLLKRKKTRDWTGSIDVDSTRVDMANLLTPLNSADFIKRHEPTFADIKAFILTVESPKYPFAIDEKRAAQGKELFAENCATCHGRYGDKRSYPNKIVPLDKIGTDPLLAEALTERNGEYFNQSWFGKEPGPDGQPIQFVKHMGYQAPPLDGVWATAPYFHNSAAPTVYHVLNSKARPKYFTRSYGSEKEDYDPVKLGHKITVLDQPPDAKATPRERRQVYDTTLPGRSNGGHTFGDDFTDEERMAVIEYLKTL